MGNLSEQQKVNESAGTTLQVPCLKCKHETKHEVLASVDLKANDTTESFSIDYWEHYQVIQCRGCETKSFRSVSGNSEDYGHDEFGDSYPIESIALFPLRTTGRAPIKDHHLLPATVRRIYEETVNAMNNNLPVLVGIGIRALVETVCNDKKASGANLSMRIDSLVQSGVLTKDGAKILHRIRTLGNASAHEVKPHATEQLVLAMDVCEHLLQGVYILPKQAKKLPKQKGKASKK